MPKINLPPGCYGITLPGGANSPRVKPGSSVTVGPEVAKAINGSTNAKLGIISGNQSVTIGTRKGRRCTQCGFLAQAWSRECPRCYAETVPEG
jgi:lipopolysaccharide biosynthesis regulator YciM